MKTLREQVIVRCPNCQITIERVTANTMVYCIACRKWCREDDVEVRVVTAPVPARQPRRRFRCH
jgi:hypothetical protein